MSGADYLAAIQRELKAGRNQWRRGSNILAAFGYVRRRQSAIDQIQAQLKRLGMSTVPAISQEMKLDRSYRFLLDTKKRTKLPDKARPEVSDDPPSTDPRAVDRGLIVGNLEAAEKLPEQIRPDDTIEAAMTTMDLRDFSQLVVTTSPRDIKGVVSYKSIARAQLQGAPTHVRHCIDSTVPQLSPEASLLDVVAQFQAHDCVLIVGVDRQLKGIVTPADIAAEFGAMAGPFLLIGEIEDRLRWLVEKRVRLDDALSTLSLREEQRRVGSADSLTMGELQMILENPKHWALVGIRYDRATFCKELDHVRTVRNAVMHFKEFDATRELRRIREFANIVQRAYSSISASS